MTLAAAAGATERIGLLTGVLLGPTREPVTLAKQAAALEQLSGGRFVLGVGVGSRLDDFEITGTSFSDRGRRLDRALEVMHAAWRGEPVAGRAGPITPRPLSGRSVPMLIGGSVEASVARVVRWAIGWISGGGGPGRAEPMYQRVRAAWSAAGREGKPEFRALQYFALGDRPEEGRAYLSDYYRGSGDAMWPGVPRDREGLREAMGWFEEIGTDELVFSPTIASIEQVELLAEAAL